MRPSSNSEIGVAFVLDKKAECKVVFDFINSNEFEEPTTAEYQRNPVLRFRDQARYLDRISTKYQGVEYFDTWAIEPNFRVLHDDVGFVFAAAQRVINEKKGAERLFNRITGRTHAAKVITAAALKTK